MRYLENMVQSWCPQKKIEKKLISLNKYKAEETAAAERMNYFMPMTELLKIKDRS